MLTSAAPSLHAQTTAAPQSTAAWKSLVLTQADTNLPSLYDTNAEIDSNMGQTCWAAQLNALVGAWGGTANHSAAEYNARALFQLKRLVSNWKAAGTYPDQFTTSCTLIAFKTLRDVSQTLGNETALQNDIRNLCVPAVQPGNNGAGNQGAQAVLGTIMGQKCWPNDAQYGLDSNLTNYVNTVWNAWHDSGDTFEPTYKYNIIWWESTVIAAHLTGKVGQLSAGANMFNRFRDSVGPAGGMPAYGDSYPMPGGGAVGMPYALAFTQMAHITDNGSFLTAADLVGFKPYAALNGSNLQYYGYMALAAGAGGYAGTLLSDAPPAKTALPSVGKAYQRTVIPGTPEIDSFILSPSKASGSSILVQELFFHVGKQTHDKPGQVGSTGLYEANNLAIITGPNTQQYLPEQASMVIVQNPAETGTATYPFRQSPPTINYTDTLISGLNESNVQTSGSNRYCAYHYTDYLDAQVRRRCVLLGTGELIVTDVIRGSATTSNWNGGPVWQLATATVPTSGTANGNTWFAGTGFANTYGSSGNCLVVMEGTSAGTTPTSGVTNTQCVYSKKTVVNGADISFVTVFLPTRTSSAASSVTIARAATNPANTLTVVVPTSGGNRTVNFTQSGWSVQ